MTEDTLQIILRIKCPTSFVVNDILLYDKALNYSDLDSITHSEGAYRPSTLHQPDNPVEVDCEFDLHAIRAFHFFTLKTIEDHGHSNPYGGPGRFYAREVRIQYE